VPIELFGAIPWAVRVSTAHVATKSAFCAICLPVGLSGCMKFGEMFSRTNTSRVAVHNILTSCARNCPWSVRRKRFVSESPIQLTGSPTNDGISTRRWTFQKMPSPSPPQQHPARLHVTRRRRRGISALSHRCWVPSTMCCAAQCQKPRHPTTEC